MVWYLSGLTCTHANVTEKGEYRAACAELGLVFVAPDTSPRGEGVPDDPAEAYDFGLGAGFYVDATEPPYIANYRMWSYVTEELPALVADGFPADVAGHSMGGHGALTIGLSYPERYKAVSAFAPIVAPSEVPWGREGVQWLSRAGPCRLAPPRHGRPDRGRRAGARPLGRPGRGPIPSWPNSCGPSGCAPPAPPRASR